MTDLSCKISFRSFFSLLSRLWFPAEAKIATEQFGRQNKTETRKNFFWKHFFWHFQLLRREWQQKQQLMGFERRSEYVWAVAGWMFSDVFVPCLRCGESVPCWGEEEAAKMRNFFLFSCVSLLLIHVRCCLRKARLQSFRKTAKLSTIFRNILQAYQWMSLHILMYKNILGYLGIPVQNKNSKKKISR